MIFDFRSGARAALSCLALVLAVLAWAPSARAAGEAPAVEAQRVVHILGYVEGDYGGAVANGAVVNASEYAEQQELLGEADRIAAGLASPDGKVDAKAEVAKVRALVDRKASAAEVAAAVAAARTRLTDAFHVAAAPSHAPDLERGKQVFAQNCASCHGATGHADTPAAAALTPHPANFHDPAVGDPLSPYRVYTTVRFGIEKTAMLPFSSMSDDDRWNVAFYVMGLRYEAAPEAAPAYPLAELATKSDAELSRELAATGAPAAKIPALLADLRRRAPYAASASSGPLLVARTKIERAREAVQRGDASGARALVVDAYLEGIEPVEGSIRAADPELARTIEDRFRDVRASLAKGEPAAQTLAALDEVGRDVARAESLIGAGASGESFTTTAIKSGTILLREGVEAALLIAALLGLAAQAGLGDKKRWVHIGWGVALVLGGVTFVASLKLIAISGASRETIEGVTALAATVVLFYVSYSLLAKREVARWMKFLRERVTPRRAALSLFGVSFLAAYREAFETVLFYQALLAERASRAAVLVGIGAAAVVLALLVLAYTRAGRFAPPQLFFRISSYLLYGLAVVFVGQGLAALQTTGVVPLHPVHLPSLGALGVYPTVETYVAQLALISAAVVAEILSRRKTPTTPVPARKPEAA